MQRAAISTPASRLPFFAPYVASDVAQIAELVVVERGKRTPALVTTRPPAPEL